MAANVALSQEPADPPEASIIKVIVTNESVYLDESLTATIHVESETKPRTPDLSRVRGFRISPLIGGEPVHDAEHGIYHFQYELMPLEAGELTLGPVTTVVGSETHETPGVTIKALEPEQSDDSRLEVTLSRTSCVVGEPITMDVRWRLGFPLQSIKAVDIQLPVLLGRDFDVFDPLLPDGGNGRDNVGLPVTNTRAIARHATEMEGEKQFATLTFSKTLVPKQPGTLVIPAGTALCSVVPIEGRFRDVWNRYPSFFDNDFFEQDIEAEHRRYFAPSEAISIEVHPLPEIARPATFAGHVGVFDIDVTAEPLECGIGEPITLTVSVVGGSHMEAFQLPSLSEQTTLSSDFRVPRLRSPAKIDADSVTFTQTIRPLHAGITQIPPIELAYFDPESGEYGISASEAIPISIENVRPLDMMAAEQSLGSDEERSRQASEDRIAFIYSADEVLAHPARQGGKAVLWALFLLVPAIAYAVLSITLTRRRWERAHPEAVRAKAAYGHFKTAIEKVGTKSADEASPFAELDAVVRGYLAARIGRNAGAITLRDIQPILARHGVSGSDQEALAELFHQFQAHRFGPTPPADPDLSPAIQSAMQTIRAIEEKLR